MEPQPGKNAHGPDSSIRQGREDLEVEKEEEWRISSNNKPS